MLTGVVVTICLVAGIVNAGDPPVPALPPENAPPVVNPVVEVAPPVPVPIGEFADASALLGALESADAGLEKLSADIRYDRVFELEGDQQVRVGRLYFDLVREVTQGPAGEKANQVRRFAVKFDRLYLGKIERRDEKIYVFDGKFYVEKTPEQKRMTVTQVVREGEEFDPLKIGEGPLPIPIGQKRDEILRRYDAVLLAADADLTDKTQLEFVKGCVQLRLTPRDAFKASDNFKEVRLWYRGKSPAVLSAADSPSERLLPRMSKTWNRSGDVSIVQLINVKVNAEASVDSGLMDASAPSGWQVTDHGFRASVPAKASEKPSSPAPIPVTESAPKGEEVPKK